MNKVTYFLFFSLLNFCAHATTYIEPNHSPSEKKAFCDSDVLEKALENLEMMSPQAYAMKARVIVTHHQQRTPGREGRSSGLILVGKDQEQKVDWKLSHTIKSPFDARGLSLDDSPPILIEHLHPNLYLDSSEKKEHKIVCTINEKDSLKQLTLRILKVDDIEIRLSGTYREHSPYPWLPSLLNFKDKRKDLEKSFEISFEKWKKMAPKFWLPTEFIVENTSPKKEARVSTVTFRALRVQIGLPTNLYEEFQSEKEKGRRITDSTLKEWESYIDQAFPPFLKETNL